MNTPTVTKSTLAQQQAAGLRALADAIETTPGLAELASYLKNGDAFFTRTDDQLAVVVAAMQAAGFTVRDESKGANVRVRFDLPAISFSCLGERRAPGCNCRHDGPCA